MIEHISLRCSDPKASRKLYEKALAPLGYKLSKTYGDAFGFISDGRHDFWVTAGEVGTPNHVAFLAPDRKAVDAFYKAALKAGATDNGAPGVREGYGYAAFIHDLDGHNIEAVIWDVEEEKPKTKKPAAKKKSASKKSKR